MKSSTTVSLRTRLLPLGLLTLLPCLPLHAAYDLPALENLEKKVQAVAQKAGPCTVAVTHAQNGGVASGSAVVVARDGLLLTAAHVVGEAKVLDVTFPDGKRYHAKVLGADYDRDVALAMITEPGDFPFVELGDTQKLAVGEMVVALGHPGGFDPKRQAPVRFGRVFDYQPDGQIRSDCTLIGGDSGGPLFDLEGKVIGVHSNVSAEMSANHDAPAGAVRKNWDRLIKGEHWGHRFEEKVAEIPAEELHDLDLAKFRKLLIAESLKGKGAIQAEPSTISQWLKDCGMKEEHVKSMDPAALVQFMQKALGGMAEVHGIDDGKLPAIPAGELAGLDLQKFKARIVSEAMKHGGRLESSPENLAHWLEESGMNAEHVKSLSLTQMMEFVKKTLGASAKVGAGVSGGGSADGSALTEEERAGLNVGKFKERVTSEALKTNGKLKLTPAKISEWLLEFGMKPERVKAMSDSEAASFLQRAIGAGTAAASQPKEGTPEEIKDLAGLDLEKFKQRLMMEGAKANGKIEAVPAVLAKWLEECGMKPERAKALPEGEITRLINRALGGRGQAKSSGQGAQISEEMKPIVAQDREILAAVSPALEKCVPSVVTLLQGGKPLALGTIVRENGFVLTKQSEIAKAKGTLQVRLSSGCTLPAKEVRQFPEYDLALVKVEATGLPALTIPGEDSGLRPGGLVFTPASSAAQPMVAMGVCSVLDRSLLESGGYFGLALGEADGGVEVGEAVPDGPCAKAGLQKKDVILTVDGKPFKAATDLSAHVRTLKPGAKVVVKYRRGGEEKTAEVVLGDRAKLPSKSHENPMQSLGTEVSDQHAGYPHIFQHDQPLRPEDCGSVVVDLHGRVVGVNIARVDRVETYAIPAKVVAGLLQTVNFDEGAPSSAKAKASDVEEMD